MKKYLLTLILLTISYSTQSQVLVKQIENRQFVELMIFGELQDLNEMRDNIEKKLWLKLYKLPNLEGNNCFPESHGICDYKYFIATSQLDDNPKTNAYNLGVLGEIIDIKWVKTDVIDEAILNIKANKYSHETIAYNIAFKK